MNTIKDALARIEHHGITTRVITVSDRDVDNVMSELEQRVSGGVSKLAAHFGSTARTRKALRREVKNTMEENADSLVRQENKRNVLDVLFAVVKESPENEKFDVRSAGKASSISADSDIAALQSLASELIEDVVQTYKIDLDFERVARAIQKLAEETPKPDLTEKRYYDNPELLFAVESAVLDEQVFEFLSARIPTKKIDVDFTQYNASGELSHRKESQVAKLTLPVVQLSKSNKCGHCPTSKCCQYVTQPISTPRSKAEFDYLLWQVSHEGVQISKDTDGWQLLFRTRCSHLQQDGACGIYETRPQICRDYTNDFCEFEGPAEADYDLCFNNYDELLAYCKQRFKRWGS